MVAAPAAMPPNPNMAAMIATMRNTTAQYNTAVTPFFDLTVPLPRVAAREQKKADAIKHPKVLNRVGLLFNEPPGTTGLPFI